jgi:adenylate cyclase
MTTSSSKKKPTILYLDDEENNLQSFIATFRRYYTIFAETSIQKAIDVLKNNEINLIITDQRMPEMSGVEFLKLIKKDFPDPVRMILTGYSDVNAIISSINDGSVLSYISKPWNEKELKELIDIAIRIQQNEKHNNELKNNLEEAINKQKTTINLLQKYAPEETVNHILEKINNNDALDIKNIKKSEVTVLFSDIR